MLKRFLPSSRKEWIRYASTFFPIIIGSTLFAANSFVDNFMVGKYNGSTALAAANSWTNINMGILIAIAASASAVMARYWGAKNYAMVREVVRLRYLTSMITSLAMAVAAIFFTTEMNKVFLSITDDPKSVEYLEMADEYMQIIVIQWIMVAITFNLGNQLREIGHAKVSMYWGIGTLGSNILLNYLLMYVFNVGIQGAAWASVAGRIVALVVGILYIRIKKLELAINPFSIFQTSSVVWKMWFSKWFITASLATVIIFINFRNYFYDIGFPTGSIAPGVGAMSVLGLTGAIMNIFTTTFKALTSMSAYFVGTELGSGNIEKAKKVGDEIKFFQTLVSIGLALIMFIVAIFTPHYTFLVDVTDPEVDYVAQLAAVRRSLYVVCLFYPSWIWFSVSYRNAAQGSKSFWFAFIDWVVSGPLQLAWLAIIDFGILPNSEFFSNNFHYVYALFFMSDFIKLIGIEILYYKMDWASPKYMNPQYRSITNR